MTTLLAAVLWTLVAALGVCGWYVILLRRDLLRLKSLYEAEKRNRFRAESRLYSREQHIGSLHQQLRGLEEIAIGSAKLSQLFPQLFAELAVAARVEDDESVNP